MKKLIFVLVAASFGLTSCNKEVKLENRLDGKWKIDSYTSKTEGVISFTATPGLGGKDTSYTTTSESPNIVTSTTGNIDFVSDNKLVMVKDINQTITSNNGTALVTTTTNNSEESVSEYYVSGEDEVTLVSSYDGDEYYTVFSVTSNEKDAQTWEYVNEDTSTDYEDDGIKTSTYTTTIKISLSLVK